MIHSLVGPIPKHRQVWVEPNACGDHGWMRAIWIGLVSYPGRAWGCNLILENGAPYRNVPLHQLAARRRATKWSVSYAQAWDCYGYGFTTLEYPYLVGMTTWARYAKHATMRGTFLFSAAPVDDGFSHHPDQAKEFYFVELDNGRFTAQPTNRVLIEDRSFTTVKTPMGPTALDQWPKNLRRQEQVWSCED